MNNRDYEGPERRNGRSGGLDLFAGLPTWVRGLVVLVGFIGTPSVIALFLVWVGATQIPAIAAQTKANYDAIIYNRELLNEHVKAQKESYRILQWICSNTSKTDVDRKNCFEQ